MHKSLHFTRRGPVLSLISICLILDLGTVEWRSHDHKSITLIFGGYREETSNTGETNNW